jgi:type II secretory pathway predicted ATPase ExeA
MYESHFHLKQKPFSLLPDPEFMMLGDQHAGAFFMLQYGLENQAGFTVITGEVGCGKTTLVRHLLNELDTDVTVGLVADTGRIDGELLQRIMLTFGLEYQGESRTVLHERMSEFLIEEYAGSRRVLLILDEAQNLDIETLEELRTLSNINADKHQLLQMILLGQPELRDKLNSHELRQFSQRISAEFHIDRLSREETSAYIAHRLTVAGGDPEVFGRAAREMVYRYSQGVPRVINMLCDTAMVYAFGANEDQVGIELMKQVLKDKIRTGYFGNEARLRLKHAEWVPDRERDVLSQPPKAPFEDPSFPELTKASEEPVAVLSDDVHVQVNQSYCDVLGYDEPGQVEGLSLQSLVLPRYRRLYEALMRESGSDNKVELELMDPELRPVPVRIEVSPTVYDLRPCQRVRLTPLASAKLSHLTPVDSRISGGR